MAKTKLNPQTDKPTNKLQLSGEFMYEYLKDKSTEEQDWYIELLDKNTNAKGEVEWKPLRDEFAKKYFSYLNESKKKMTYKDKVLKAFGRI